MQHIIIYSERSSPRLLYVLNWLLKGRFHTEYTLVHDADMDCHISYGRKNKNALYVPDAGLLWQQGISPHEIKTGSWQDIPTLYADAVGDIPFDIFSAIFFLLSRYEEYYSFTPDKHDRYPATESILYKMGCLQRPIVDEWVEALRDIMNMQYAQHIAPGTFSFLPSYDIDIAWSFRNKGLARNAGGMLKNIISGNMADAAERSAVLSGARKDPYDSFDEIKDLHATHSLRPVYFILAALRTTDFDKNISPLQPEMQLLIKQLAAEGEIGIHPSYYSDIQPQLTAEEKQTVEAASGKSIHKSRQHYIKLRFPGTYTLLMQNGITDDYSMGYSTRLGFRAGTGRSFMWYDLSTETEQHLRLHPFCFMDTTALYDMGLSVAKAFDILAAMQHKLQSTGSTLVTIFHNFSLGSDRKWHGWYKAYSKFLADLSDLIS